MIASKPPERSPLPLPCCPHCSHSLLQTIKRLERQIAEYEAEITHGSREIDAIQADLARARREITALRREHLNAFYFF
jgi:septal ring factor EnvC (AmiA/AmiB activator)